MGKMGLNDEVDMATMRKDERLDIGSTALLIFKATVGLGLYSYQFGFGKVGVIAGFVFSFLQGIFVAYPMWRLVRMADTLEAEKTAEQKLMSERTSDMGDSLISEVDMDLNMSINNETSQEMMPAIDASEEIIVKRYQDLPVMIGFEGAKVFETFTLLTTSVFNFFALIASLTLLSEIIVDGTKNNLMIMAYTARLATFIMFAVILLVIHSLERLKFITPFIILIMMTIAALFFGESCYQIFNSVSNDGFSSLSNVAYFNLAEIGFFMGISSYSFQSIGSIFNIRRAMKVRSKMPTLLMIMTLVIAFMYAFLSLIIYLVSTPSF